MEQTHEEFLKRLLKDAEWDLMLLALEFRLIDRDGDDSPKPKEYGGIRGLTRLVIDHVRKIHEAPKPPHDASQALSNIIDLMRTWKIASVAITGQRVEVTSAPLRTNDQPEQAPLQPKASDESHHVADASAYHRWPTPGAPIPPYDAGGQASVGDILTAADTLSGDAFEDECAMRAMQALLTHDPKSLELGHRWMGAVTVARNVGVAMLAERKRRRG